MDENNFLNAIEDATTRQVCAECEVVVLRELIYRMIREMRGHPVAGFKWDTILSNETLSKISRVENGEYLSNEMKDMVDRDLE